MGLKRIQHVLALVVAFFVLGASSQAAVCELACGLQVHAPGCHAGMAAMSGSAMSGGAAMSTMEHSVSAHAAHVHCSHRTIPVQGMVHSVGNCPDGSCNHIAVSAMDKSSALSVSFAAVQWMALAVVPMEVMLPRGFAGAGRRPPLVASGVDPLVVNLRV